MTLHQLFGLCLFGGTALFLAIGSAVAYIAAHISVRLERKRAAQERIEARNRQREQEILNDMNTDYYGLRWEKKDL